MRILLLALIVIAMVVWLPACGSGCESAGTPSSNPAANAPPPSGSSPGSQMPSLGAVAPASGNGRTQDFVATYSHPSGAKNVITSFILIEKGMTGINSCFVSYNTSAKNVNLMGDHAQWGKAVPAGSSNTLANTQCSVDASRVKAEIDGNNLQVTYPITFSSSYSGAKKVYLQASAEKVFTPWTEKGSWIVP
jgi:hypothetical protein